MKTTQGERPLIWRVSERPRRMLGFVSKYGTLIGMGLMIACFSLVAPRSFPTFTNLVNVLNQASLTAIIAAGLTITLVAGEMDLSIGYNASLAGVLIAGLMVNQGLPMPYAIALVLLGGAAIGWMNGVIVTKLGVNAVVATLGTGTVFIGLSFAYSAGIPIAAGMPEEFLRISLGRAFGVPHNILIMAGVLCLLWVVLNHTDLGQHIQAVGGNIEAARFSGIRVDRTKIAAFIIAGMCAALTGILLSSLIGSGSTGAGDSYLLDAFTAAFLGSATLRDGEFHIVGTFLGVLLIGIGFNGLGILGAPTYYQHVFKGATLVLAVALSTVARSYART
jgi:ribose transport system permease protein